MEYSIMHLMPIDRFEALERRWGMIKKSPAYESKVDELIRTAVEGINRHPHMVTIFSCQGHPEQKDSPYSDGGYIMMGVRNPDTLYEIFRIFSKFLGAEAYKVRLDMTYRADILNLPAETLWPVYILRWDITEDTVGHCAKQLNRAVAFVLGF